MRSRPDVCAEIRLTPDRARTGGLADTIEDGVTGFLFGELSLRDFVRAIRRGAAAFHSSTRLASMRKAAMERPQGWAQAGNSMPTSTVTRGAWRRRPERGRSVSPPKELRSGNRWPENTWNQRDRAMSAAAAGETAGRSISLRMGDAAVGF